MDKLKNDTIKDGNGYLSYKVKGNIIEIIDIKYHTLNNLLRMIDLLVVANLNRLKKGSCLFYGGDIDFAKCHFRKHEDGYRLSINDFKIKRFVAIGSGKTGNLNKITDVEGVEVGNYTLNQEDYHTGITVIRPSSGNTFLSKLVASSYVYNGFGKSIGLIQVDEMGTIETDVSFTSTLNAGKIADAAIEEILKNNPEVGYTTGTVNPVVMECNDGGLNKSRDRILDKDAYKKALNVLKKDFAEGDVGAGCGMTCFGMKGGIGSSSRKILVAGKEYTMGIILNANFGTDDGSAFIFNGRNIGKDLKFSSSGKESGSVVAVLATDLPLDSRQLKRLLKRIEIGIGRTGSYGGGGSGDVFLGFTTANRVAHFPASLIEEVKRASDDILDVCFRRVVEMTEEAVLNAMLNAEGKKGYLRTASSLIDYIDLYIDLLMPEIEYDL